MSRKSPTRNGSPLYWSAESWAIISLRLFLSLRFILAGLGKFKGEEGYSFENYYQGVIPWMTSTFAEKTNLPGFLVVPYAYTIGYVEIILGVLLLLGIKTKYVLALFALTFVSLAYGQMLLGDGKSVSDLAIHLMITAAALYLVRHNKLEALR
ncbi:DoxX family membrane protein [Pelagicoccus sp. SDUM812003]|uniref:DoxX family membrane protein n=1 Tax=Pelagicoccus sp. SDUM812003 TaxID=3041267 RepID=UPI00280CA11F|nr:DoxX family membrane protein [Pelagicoccus sp. SDUM812003]MDQ8201612.1 DoxX family membrane protein [Pelagicoccus sp. SDUM812003]